MFRRDHFLSCLALLSVVSGCAQQMEETPPRGADDGPVIRVTTVSPERMTLRRVTEEPGRVEPFESAPIHAKLAGYVKVVNVDIGDKVTRGQVLAELDVPEIEADAQRTRAGVTRAEAEARQSEAAVEVARSSLAAAEARKVEAEATTRRTEADLSRWKAEYARIEQLLRESAVTGSLRDETRGKLESARAAAEETEAKVQSALAAIQEAHAALVKAGADAAASIAAVDVAKAEARRAEALFGYHKITAPFNGVVNRRRVDPGHLTVPGGTAEPLFEVARVDKLTVVVDVPEVDAALVNAGDSARIRIQAMDGKVVEGKVSRTSVSLNESSRTLRVEIDLPGDIGGPETIRPGSYAYARIIADLRPCALSLPVSAVVREGGKTFVVVDDGGKAKRRPVVLGLSDGSRVEVVSGLKEGEAVVLANADVLTDGQPLQAAPLEKPAESKAKK